MSVIDEIAAERKRQIEVEGYTPDHDIDHSDASLAAAAAIYALGTVGPISDTLSMFWPEGWDYKPHSQLSDLIRAGALIAAEIDRLQTEPQI